MAYSQKSFRLFRYGGHAFLFGGAAILIVLAKCRVIDGTLYMCLLGVLTVAASSLILHAHHYKDEIQRQAAEKRIYWGYQIGIIASVLVLVVVMMPDVTWLDSLMHFIGGNHVAPRIYFGAGFMLPTLCQALGALSMRLLAGLRRGEQA